MRLRIIREAGEMQNAKNGTSKRSKETNHGTM
jgi:hypothetical protein